MSLLDLHQELTHKEYPLKDQLLEMEFEMDVIKKNIQGHELDSLISENEIQPLYQKLWTLQSKYDNHQQELQQVQSRLIEVEELVRGVSNTTP